jgi:hypothetical protein
LSLTPKLKNIPASDLAKGTYDYVEAHLLRLGGITVLFNQASIMSDFVVGLFAAFLLLSLPFPTT